MSLDIQRGQETKLQKSGLISKLMKSLLVKDKTETREITEVDEIQDLLESISSAKKEWICANMNFEYASDEQVVDYYAYKIKACEVRYEYLIKKAKEKGIRVEPLDMASGNF